MAYFALPSTLDGMSRRAGDVRRMLQWHVRPETEVPAWQASDWVELWVRGGEIAINGQRAHANCFIVIEPGATVRIASVFGALVLGWAEELKCRVPTR